MVPVTPVAVSLFGAPLGVPPILASKSDSTVDLASGTSPALTAYGSIPGAVQGSVEVQGIPGTPFANLLTEAVGQVEKLEGQARSAVEGLMSGKGVDVHEAMIATEKADMGFQMVLSVRNKALSAYQQVMGMQF